MKLIFENYRRGNLIEQIDPRLSVMSPEGPKYVGQLLIGLESYTAANSDKFKRTIKAYDSESY